MSERPAQLPCADARVRARCVLIISVLGLRAVRQSTFVANAVALARSTRSVDHSRTNLNVSAERVARLPPSGILMSDTRRYPLIPP